MKLQKIKAPLYITEVKEIFRSFIKKNMKIFEEVVITDNDNIFERGFVDSMFAMKLVMYIEENFDYELDNDDLNLKNFNSINNIILFLERKKLI